MAALSSNWKKLQAKIKEESTENKTLKRKLEAPPTNQRPKKTAKSSSEQKATHKKPVKSKARSKSHTIQMGGVHSSKIETEPGQGSSSSVALWSHGKATPITAEALAEAYNLGTRDDNSMMLASQSDVINQGLAEGIEIGKYIAIDCEMVGVGPGGYESALARVSVVDYHGKQVYDSFVRPKEKVTNWRTAVSGISQKSMRFARDFEEVQQEVDKLLEGRIVIAHDVKHDLEALKLSHPPKDIRDTAKFTGFRSYGNGRKPALRVLAQQILGIEIQSGAHSSTEDARVTMLLFRKHKPEFDVEHSNRYPTKPASKSATQKGTKSKKKHKS